MLVNSVVVIIIVYIVLYIIDVAEMSVPIVLNVPINQYPSPRYEFIPDYNGYFDSKADKPNLNEDKPYTGYLQLVDMMLQKIMDYIIMYILVKKLIQLIQLVEK